MTSEKIRTNHTASVSSYVYFSGNAITLIGCMLLLLGLAGVFDMQLFSFGLSSGIRVIGTVAIAGCLLSAIGYGIQDFMITKSTLGD
jgi:hypothetical protein